MSKEWWNYQISLRQAFQYVCRPEESLKAKISGQKYDENDFQGRLYEAKGIFQRSETILYERICDTWIHQNLWKFIAQSRS